MTDQQAGAALESPTDRASSASTSAAVSGGREIVATRILDAPRSLVWDVLTNPDHLARWWGPVGFTTSVTEMDLRPGGIRRIVMHGPDGTDYPGIGRFIEIVPGERLVFTDAFDQDEPAPHGEMTATITLEDEGAGTRLTFRTRFASAADLTAALDEVGALEGLDSTLDSLAAYLRSVRTR